MTTMEQDFFDSPATSGDTFHRDFFDSRPDPDADTEGVERPPRDEDAIVRDKRGRPRIWVLDEHGDLAYEDKGRKRPKLRSYTRTTTWAKMLEDTTNLSRWAQRMTAIGVASNPDIQLSILSHPHVKMDRDALNQDVEDAKERAKASAMSRTGTAMHALSERYDRGLEIGFVPPLYKADLDAYIEATKFFRMIEIERFTVVDEYKIGGTPDRILQYLPCPKCGGDYYIGDLKTGNIELGADAIAIQLAIGANGKIYKPSTGERIELPERLCKHKAVIFHLPQGEGVCRLEWTNIEAGWAKMDFIAELRRHRAINDWSVGFDAVPTPWWLHEQIQKTASRAEVLELFAQYRPWWTDEHSEAAGALWPKGES